MPPSDVSVVQRFLEYFIENGEPQWDALHEKVEVHDHDMPDAGDYRGHAGFARWLEEWGMAWAEWSIEPEDFMDIEGRVVVFLRMKAKGHSGVALKRDDAMVFVLQNVDIVRIDYYNNRPQALESISANKTVGR